MRCGNIKGRAGRESDNPYAFTEGSLQLQCCSILMFAGWKKTGIIRKGEGRTVG